MPLDGQHKLSARQLQRFNNPFRCRCRHVQTTGQLRNRLVMPCQVAPLQFRAQRLRARAIMRGRLPEFNRAQIGSSAGETFGDVR